MKRRSLLLLSLLAFPGRLFGQDSPRRPSPKARRVSNEDEGADLDAPPVRKSRAKAADEELQESGGPPEGTPANFPNQSGFAWKTFSIANYTALDSAASSPQTAIVDWILRRTLTAPWHGDKIAVLCASRTQIRAYNSTKILDQVERVVEQFTDATANIINVRVRFIAAADSRWRYAVHQRLTPTGSGPQGQQIWHTTNADAEMVISQMQVWQGFKLLGNTNVEVLNGQTLKFTRTEDRPFTGGVQRDGAVGTGFQPKIEKLEEGIVLRFSPLLSYDGDTLDAAIELSTNLVRKLHPVKVLAPREVGPGEISIDVPEVSETRLNQTVKNWPIGQALIISAGVQPGILLDKGGLFNMKIPGTVPSGTELLVVINAEIVKGKKADRGS